MRTACGALVAALALGIASLPGQAAIKAWLDSHDAAPGDTLELTLEHDGPASGQPDLTPLQRDFEVLGSNTSTSIEIANGRTTARTEVTVNLSPRHAGRLTIPPLSWEGEQSAPIALAVVATSPAGVQARPVFLESEVDPKEPYVQAAVHVTVRLYTREALYDPHLMFASGASALIRQVGTDEQGSVERGGASYEVLTRHYLLFPQQSGSLSLPGPALTAEVPAAQRALNPWGSSPFAGVFGTTPLIGNMLAMARPIHVQGEPITLQVRARPAAAVGGYWLPARDLTLQSIWHPATLQGNAGDPLTVDLTLQADGLTAAQLPDLTQLLELPAGLRSYPDAPKLSDSARGDSVLGVRSQSIAFIADQPGRFTIPELHVRWWDTRANAEREATLPERALVVLPAASASGSRAGRLAPAAQAALPPRRQAAAAATHGPAAGLPSAGAGTRAAPWLWLSVALGTAWIVTLAAWLRLRRRMASRARPRAAAAAGGGVMVTPPAVRCRTAFRLACRRDDAPAARRDLLAWVRAVWPEPAPVGLNALARRIADPSLAALVRELDRACYGGEPWRGEALASALRELPVPPPGSGEERSMLAPLYPQIDASRAGYV